MLKISMNNIQFEYDQNKKSLEEYYNLKREYILESSQLEIAELERRSALAKNASEKKQIETKIEKVKNNFVLDLNKLDVFKRDKTYSNINKDTDKILSDQAYQDKYADIQTKMNPMKKLDIDENNRNNKLATIAQLKEQMTKLQDLQNSEGGENIEGLTEKIKNLDIATKELQATSLSTFEQMGQDIQQAAGAALASGLNTFFNDLIDGSKSASEALKDFVRNFIKSIAQIIVQAMAAYAALLIINAIPGGTAVTSALDLAAKANNANKVVKGARTASAGQHHTGGIAGSSGVRRNIDLATYSHAPRYHTGGVAGFAPNEVPAILERGEEVLTRNDPRHVANGGGGTGGSITVKNINVFTEEQAIEHMNSPAGERAQINMVQRNASAIKRILEDS